MAVGENNQYVPKGYLGLLFVEPISDPAALPLIDELTRKMTAAYRKSTVSNPYRAYRGVHHCSCGVASDNMDHFIRSTYVTNSLAIHYLAYHRSEIPQKELDKVAMLQDGLETPSTSELAGPKRESLQVDSSFCGSFADYLKSQSKGC